MNRGYVKLWRKIRDGDLIQNPPALALWIWMLTRANHKFTSVCPNGVRIDLKPGQMLYGREYASKAINQSVRTTRTAFAYLHTTERVTSRPTNRGTVVTIVNWQLYQSGEDENDQQTDPQVTSRRPAGDHSEEAKEAKEKKKTLSRKPRRVYPPEFESLWKAYTGKGTKGKAFDVWSTFDPTDHDWLLERATAFRKIVPKGHPKYSYTKDLERWLKDDGASFDEEATRQQHAPDPGSHKFPASLPAAPSSDVTRDNMRRLRGSSENSNDNTLEEQEANLASA